MLVVTLQRPTYFVLASLMDGPLHGYGILGRVEELSGGSLRLAVGTLYGALDRLSEAGFVEPDRVERVEGRTRRYYRLTEEGRRRLGIEAVAMAEAARVVTDRLPRDLALETGQ